MRRMIYQWMATAAIAAVLIGFFVGCEKTVREPGESEHGGVFLHADAPPAPLPSTR